MTSAFAAIDGAAPGRLALVDWWIIVIYLMAIIAFGIRMGRGTDGARAYFLGSRSVSWWAAGFSILATETSALTFLGIPAIAYNSDLSFIQIVVGYVIARLAIAAYMVPKYFRGDVYSPYQLMEKVFGVTGRRATGGVFLLSGVLAAGVRVYITCIPLQLILGLSRDQIIWVILLFVLLSLIYTYLGGIKAVIWTDVVQFVLLVGGGVFAALFIPTLLEGGIGEIAREASGEGKLRWWNTGSFLTLDNGYSIWMGVFGATFLTLGTHGVDQLNVQRLLACRDVPGARRALILSAVLILPLFLLFLWVGVSLWAWAKANGFDLGMPVPELRPGVSQTDYVFPIFILTQVPIGLKALLIVAVLSAAMSSVSSALSALASVSTMDFLPKNVKDHTDRQLLNRSRLMTIVWAGALAGVAFLSQYSESALTLALALSGLTNGAMLGALGLALFGRGALNRFALVGAMAASICVMAGIHFIPRAPEEAPLRLLWEKTFQGALAWPWYSPLGLIVMLGVFTLLSRVRRDSSWSQGA